MRVSSLVWARVRRAVVAKAVVEASIARERRPTANSDGSPSSTPAARAARSRAGRAGVHLSPGRSVQERSARATNATGRFFMVEHDGDVDVCDSVSVSPSVRHHRVSIEPVSESRPNPRSDALAESRDRLFVDAARTRSANGIHCAPAAQPRWSRRDGPSPGDVAAEPSQRTQEAAPAVMCAALPVAAVDELSKPAADERSATPRVQAEIPGKISSPSRRDLRLHVFRVEPAEAY